MDNADFRILIVDDEESIRESMKLHLESLGYTVIAAKDPSLCPVYCRGQCAAENRCADVIFIDQNMPEMSGLEFIRMQAKRGCKLPARYKLLMTGDLSEEVRSLAEALGCRVEEKPLTLEEAEAFVLFAKKRIGTKLAQTVT